MKTTPKFLLAFAALALACTAAYAGPSESVAQGLAAAKKNSMVKPTATIAYLNARKGCDTMVVAPTNAKGQPYYANCNSPAVRNTAKCEKMCAR